MYCTPRPILNRPRKESGGKNAPRRLERERALLGADLSQNGPATAGAAATAPIIVAVGSLQQLDHFGLPGLGTSLLDMGGINASVCELLEGFLCTKMIVLFYGSGVSFSFLLSLCCHVLFLGLRVASQ